MLSKGLVGEVGGVETKTSSLLLSMLKPTDIALQSSLMLSASGVLLDVLFVVVASGIGATARFQVVQQRRRFSLKTL